MPGAADREEVTLPTESGTTELVLVSSARDGLSLRRDDLAAVPTHAVIETMPISYHERQKLARHKRRGQLVRATCHIRQHSFMQ